jgi:hypothetical protein
VTQGFDTTVTGTNKQEICDGPTKKARWEAAFAKPVVPPRQGAGIDLAGGDSWAGLTVEQAEQINCQSTNDADGENYWGDNGEVYFDYYTSTRKIYYMGFNAGYTGAINFHSRDGAHTYKLAVNAQIQKDNQPMVINWNGTSAPCTTGTCDWAAELGDALLATFAPGLPSEAPPTGNCRLTGHCIIGHFGDSAYFFVPSIGFAWRTASFVAAQPTPSTVSWMDQYLEKVLPFSLADVSMKMDQEGPTAVQTNLGPDNRTCTLKLAMTYGTLMHDCVQVANDPTADATEKAKLLGGIEHSTERFHFDVSGVDVNFSDNTLAADNVVRDADRPTDDDYASEFQVDQSTLGLVLNDRTGNQHAGALDLHMMGLIYAEYVSQVQAALNATLPAAKRHPIGDPACLTGAGNPKADGCTGFEGFAIPTAATRIDDAALATQAGLPASGSRLTSLRTGMKPGHQSVGFCDGMNRVDCITVGDTFVTSFNRMLEVYAQGDARNLPTEMKDARFFYRLWSIAFFKFLMAEKVDGSTKFSDVHNAPLQYDDLFFDSVGAGQFEISEYVDRRFASATQDPTDIRLEADIHNGIVDSYDFSREIYRGETALYLSARTNTMDSAGKEPALLTNVFGSPAIAAAWKDEGPGKDAFTCATDVTRAKGCSTPPALNNGVPLLDDHGRPIMSQYKGAFSATGTVLHLGGQSPIKLATSTAMAAIQSAMISLPLHADSYDLTTPPLDPAKRYFDFLVPYLPKQPGVGFPVALSGTRDKFIDTAQIDLTGTTVSANVDIDLFDPLYPAKGYTLKAVETTDFLGYVFLCVDPDSNDVLAVKMYSPAADILDWIDKHPATVDSCGMVVRYSPYNNFPDYITSLTNGVRLGITQGGGFGRVVDVTLFSPGQ